MTQKVSNWIRAIVGPLLIFLALIVIGEGVLGTFFSALFGAAALCVGGWLILTGLGVGQGESSTPPSAPGSPNGPSAPSDPPSGPGDEEEEG